MDHSFRFRLFSFLPAITIPKQWVRAMIVVGVIVVSPLIAYWGSSTIWALILLLLGGIAGALILVELPSLGFILIFLGAMFVPFTGPGGVNAATLLVAAMLGLWIMNMFVVQRGFQFVRSLAMIPVLIFLVIATLAFFFGQLTWFVFAYHAPIDAQIGGYVLVVFSVGGLLLAAHLIKDIRWLQIIVWVFLGLAALYIAGQVLSLPSMDRIFHYGVTSQSMFWTWLVTLAFSQVIYNDSLSRWKKGLLLALVLCTFYVSFVKGYEWKSGWVPPLVAVITLLAIRYRHITIFALPLAITGALYIAVDLIASDQYSWGTRVDAWNIVLDLSEVSPFLGTGFANYYWYTPLIPIRGWRVNFNSHSQYIDLIAQTGYLGLISFALLLFVLGRLSWKLSQRSSNGFALAYAHAGLSGIIATYVAAFLGDWVLPFVYNVGWAGFRAGILAWIFMGGIISLEQILRAEGTRSG